MTPMENMLNVMNLNPAGLTAVCLTSDGHYLGQRPGEIGYNYFLGPAGHHNGPGKKYSLDTWNALTPQEQADVLTLAASPPDGEPIPILNFPGLNL